MSKNKNVIISKNFELAKIVRKAPHLISSIQNTMINHVNKSIQDNLDAGKDYKGENFDSLSTESTTKIKGHSTPLKDRGMRPLANSLRSTKIKRATKDDLVSRINMVGKAGNQSNVTGRNGKTYSVKRKKAAYKIGAIHNVGYTTASTSMIPNKTVPARKWFGIPPQMQGGGRQFNKFLDELITKVRKTGYLGRFKRVK